MGIREAIKGFSTGLRQTTPTTRPPINVTQGLGELQVVDTSKLPTSAQVPGSWARAFLGPGQPFQINSDNARTEDKENEPRSFQYISSVNSTMSPRLAYGLMAFSDLRTYAETVPEVAMCMRLLTEEMKAFVPTIVDANDNKVPNSPYQWMCTRPDGFNPFTVWLSRFLYNVLVYDAGCAYMVRDRRKKIRGTRVIDGSTIFVVIDEKGEQPKPPAPAFQQIIWGVPRIFLNTRQLWYKPRHLRADAPYGRSPIEDALPAVRLLQSLWDYEFEKYQIGNIPEMVFTVPENWKDNVDAIFEFEEAFNARMSGSNQERVRARFLPAGMAALNTKELTFNKESYEASTNAVRLSYGIPQSEVGESPNSGLGGSGYAEAMQSTFYRMGLAPLMNYSESHFNDIIEMNGDQDLYKFKLEFPAESLDPQKEEEKFSTRFQIGGITRDEYRQGIQLKAFGGEVGEFIVTPGQGAGGEEDGGEDPFGGMLGGGKKPGMVNVGNSKNVQVRRPVGVMKHPIKVAKKPLSVYKGAGFDTAHVKEIGDKLGVDWAVVDLSEFESGMDEELEHAETVGNDIETVAQIALDHLNEDPKYYSKLKALFAKYEASALQKFCGVDPEDDMLYGSAVVQNIDVNMPKQGANESQIVSIGGGAELDARPAVWKPLSGEKSSLKGWIHGDLYRRAEAAYILDRELAPDEKHHLVPLSYTTQVDGEVGSVQHYVTGRQPREDVRYYGNEWVEQAAVLDFIMGQMDRTRKNWLTHPHDDDRPILIDSDISFSPDKDQKIHSSFVDAMIDRPLTQKTLDSIYTALGNHDLWEDLQDILEDEDAVANARARAEQIHHAGRIELMQPVAVINHGDESEASSINDPILVKADWEESKHPRANDGKFTSGAGGGGAQAAPPSAPKRIGTSTVGRAKAIIEARRIQDEEEAKAKAGGGKHVVGMRSSEKAEWEKLKLERDKAKQAKEQSVNQHKDRVALYGRKFIEYENKYDKINRNDPDDEDRHIYHAAQRSAIRLRDYHQDKADGKQPMLNEAEVNKKLDDLIAVQDYENAMQNNDVAGANKVRARFGVALKPEKAPTPKPPTPAPKPVAKPPVAGVPLVKNPVRNHIHRDTPEKTAALSALSMHMEGLSKNEIAGVTHAEFYGKICQSGADFDRVKVLLHVKGALNQAQQDYNISNPKADLAHKQAGYEVKFVSDTDKGDKATIEKIRRDNRDQRLGHTSIHTVSERAMGGLHVHGTGRRPETVGGTHGEEALKLKANPGAHIWNKLRELKGGGGMAVKPPPAGGGKVSDDIIKHISERKFTSDVRRELVQKFATNALDRKEANGKAGANPSYKISITDDGKAIMKDFPGANAERGAYGFPHTEVVASDIAETMGFGVVPATGFRDDPTLGRCSVQEWVEGNLSVSGDMDAKDARPRAHETLSQMLVLTTLTGNTDRHRGNFIVDRDTGEFIAIDNGFCCAHAVLGPKRDPWSRTNEERASKGWDRANESTVGYKMVSADFKINPDHVKAADDFVNGDGGKTMDATLRRTFGTPDFCEQMRKNGDGYKGMSDGAVTDMAVARAKDQLKAGLAEIKKHI